MDEKLLGLVLLAVPLSLLSFGGGQTIVVGLGHQVVNVHHWLTGPQFADLFAISRAAPGPSTLILALIGWQLGGLTGAIMATLAIFVPSSLLLCLVGHWWQKRKGSAWAVAVERGLAPIAVGLIFGGAYVVAQSANLNLVGLATIAVATALLYFTRIGTYTLLGAVALVYLGLAFWQT